jgi:hypothetical protein
MKINVNKSTSAKIEKPQFVLDLENKLALKFKGPFSDGRQWDTIIQCSKPLAKMETIAKLHKVLDNMSIKKESNNISSTFGFVVNKNTYLGIDVVRQGVEITVYTD